MKYKLQIMVALTYEDKDIEVEVDSFTHLLLPIKDWAFLKQKLPSSKS